MELKICENPDCRKEFEPKVHNAIYCGPECRRIITNQKVLDNYYEKKERKAAGKRTCQTKDCDTILSRYNDEEICSSCAVVRLKDRLEGWGWDRKQLDIDWSY